MLPTHPVAPEVSVIVMTLNRPELLRQCLDSLAAQTLSREAFEVVVVDGSDPPVDDVVAAFSGRLRVVHDIGPNLGVAGNRNRGVARSRGRIIAFLDDDCLAHPSWLARIKAAVEASPNCVVGGFVENPGPAESYSAAGQTITEAVYDFYNPPGEEPRFFPGLNFSLERERYLSVGGCDARFGRLAAEDRDFIDRWRLAGGRMAACPEATVRHEHRSNLRDFVRQYFNYGRGAWRYHNLRRQRQSGHMSEDARLHLSLHRLCRKPLRRLTPGMRVKVIALLGVWQLANLAGFLLQAVLDTAVRRAAARSRAP